MKAAAKKMKLKKFLKKIGNVNESDDDGSITSDDVDILEDEFLGNIIEDQYFIIRYIGRGTFSRVWLTYDIANNKYVIFKVYFKNEKDEFECELKALNLIKEKKFEYNLNFDSYLKTNFELNQGSENNCCLLLPYKGLSLSDIADYKGNISINEIKYITKQILNGLKELHSIKILHTYLKLDNILSNYYKDSEKKFINWFNSLNIQEQYNKLFVINTPEDFVSYNRNKKKLYKRKIKHRTLKAISLFLKKKINEYYDGDIDEDEDADEDDYNSNVLDQYTHKLEKHIPHQILLLRYNSALPYLYTQNYLQRKILRID